MANPKKITLVIVALVAATLLASCGDAIGDRYVGFAQCLTEKGVTMYGAYWCPHCANQKKMFGKAGFEKINYVECDARGYNAKPELCTPEKVKGYPTWEFPNDEIIGSVLPLSVLAEKSGCALPADEA